MYLTTNFKYKHNQLIRRFTNQSSLELDNKCTDIFFCPHAHSDMELKYWTQMKYFHKSLLDLCNFESIKADDCLDELSIISYLISLMKGKRNKELESYIDYFDNKDYLEKEFKICNITFISLFDESFKSANFEFINFLYDKYFKHICLDYNFNFEEDIELIKYVVGLIQEMGDVDSYFYAVFHAIPNKDASQLRFFEFLNENFDDDDIFFCYN